MNFNKLYLWLQNNYHPGSYVTMNDKSNFAKMFCEFISKIIFFLHALWSIRHPDWIFFFQHSGCSKVKSLFNNAGAVFIVCVYRVWSCCQKKQTKSKMWKKMQTFLCLFFFTNTFRAGKLLQDLSKHSSSSDLGMVKHPKPHLLFPCWTSILHVPLEHEVN